MYVHIPIKKDFDQRIATKIYIILGKPFKTLGKLQMKTLNRA